MRAALGTPAHHHACSYMSSRIGDTLDYLQAVGLGQRM